MSDARANEPARIFSMYRTMCLIREFEDVAGQNFFAGNIRGSVHQYIGEEAIAVGVCAHLRPTDYLLSTHRGHGHSIAKGADPARMMKELFGKQGGTSGGKGGSMHIADFSVGMLGANGVVAAGIPIAVGAAHALKVKKKPHIVACFFGDGAVNRGPFLEGLNWAGVYRLPVLFVCEDNRISATTPTGPMTAGEGPSARARSMGIRCENVDGNDVVAVDRAAGELAEWVRKGNGPAFLHAVTYRFKGHVSVDPGAYRDPKEVEQALAYDPIKLARNELIEAGEPVAAIDEIDTAAKIEVDVALTIAKSSPWPDAATAYEDVMDSGKGQWK